MLETLAVDLQRRGDRLDPAELLQHPARARLRVRAGLREVLHRRDGDPVERRRASAARCRCASRSRIGGRSSLAVREPVRVRQRTAGRRRAPGSPMRSQSRRKRRSFAAAIISSPSAVGKHLVRRDQRERRAMPARRDAGLQRGGQLVADERERRVEESDADLAPAAGRAVRSSSAATIPSAAQTPVPMSITRRADAHARPVGLAGDADRGPRTPASAGRSRARPRAARSGRTPDRAVDEPVVPSRAARRCRARGALQRPRASTARTTSAPSTSRSSASVPALVLDVERERPLRAVRREEHDAAAREERRPPGARLVAAPWMLDLHDVGAETAEDLRAGRPGERRRQVDDANAGERREAHRARI